MISRGGTSLVITMVVFGLLANFARREPQAAAALRSQGPGRMARFLGLGVKPPKAPKERKRRKEPSARQSAKVQKSRAEARLRAPKGRDQGAAESRRRTDRRPQQSDARPSGATQRRPVPADRSMPTRPRSARRSNDERDGDGRPAGRTVRR